jgi:hypothetical protein
MVMALGGNGPRSAGSAWDLCRDSFDGRLSGRGADVTVVSTSLNHIRTVLLCGTLPCSPIPAQCVAGHSLSSRGFGRRDKGERRRLGGVRRGDGAHIKDMECLAEDDAEVTDWGDTAAGLYAIQFRSKGGRSCVKSTGGSASGCFGKLEPANSWHWPAYR